MPAQCTRASPTRPTISALKRTRANAPHTSYTKINRDTMCVCVYIYIYICLRVCVCVCYSGHIVTPYSYIYKAAQQTEAVPAQTRKHVPAIPRAYVHRHARTLPPRTTSRAHTSARTQAQLAHFPCSYASMLRRATHTPACVVQPCTHTNTSAHMRTRPQPVHTSACRHTQAPHVNRRTRAPTRTY